MFDFQITSDFEEPYIDGDINLYSTDPFEYKKKEENEESLIDMALNGVFKDYGDHAELFGFNLLKFDAMKEKLDKLNKQGKFKGFAPRWTLPTKLRNVENPNLNTSCLLLAIDSARESDLELMPYFSKSIIGDNEIMVANSALKHLDTTSTRKEKLEVYFDLAAIMEMFTAVTPSLGDDGEKQSFGGSIQ